MTSGTIKEAEIKAYKKALSMIHSERTKLKNQYRYTLGERLAMEELHTRTLHRINEAIKELESE